MSSTECPPATFISISVAAFRTPSGSRHYLAYEANAVDRREWDEKRVLDSLEAFLSCLGLSELPE